jgi:hypothetical protein
MIENLPKRLVLLAALLGGLPVGLAAQAGTTRTTRRTAPPPPSSCCSAPGRGARRSAARTPASPTMSAHCTTTRPVPHLTRPGIWWAPTTTSRIPAQLGRLCPPFSGGARAVGVQIGTFGFGPAGLHDRTARWNRVGVLS